jgi:phospholipid/cholesterol/gamma-HCH transport system permease protein
MLIIAPPLIKIDAKHQSCTLTGAWSIQSIASIIWPDIALFKKELLIDCSNMQKMDSAGAYALFEWCKTLEAHQIKTTLQGMCEEKEALYKLLTQKLPKEPYHPPEKDQHSFFYKVGKHATEKYHQMLGFLTLVGDMLLTMYHNLGNSKRLHVDYIISNIAQTGIYALPIIGLLSFLIGIVLAYQMGLQLETYGANIYIAFLSGMAIFREFGPLITAIIVAGRTSSAFTAQIGSMKINEEIDALETMGLSPTEFLVVPKVIGLTLAFPLLIFWSNFFGILGSMFMSKLMLHVSYHDFLLRLKDSVGLKQLMLGLYKAPAFSILIALVGCFQGFQVGGSADSVGHQTTKSVVQALFLIIITDAIYSIIYSALDL